MKKTFILTLLILFGTVGCSSHKYCHSEAECSEIPNGYIDKQEYYDKEGFRDYTDYAKYTYSTQDIIVNNNNYRKVTSNDFVDIENYLENFRSWMEVEHRLDEFDFDENIINEGDYIRIKTKEGEEIGGSKYGKYDNYSIYFFDIETLTLYYMHNNN